MKVLIVYATTEGQTQKIAEKIAGQIRELGHDVDLVDLGHKRKGLNPDDFDAAIVAASVHQKTHQEEIEIFATASREILGTKRTMFLSVSLSAAFGEGHAEAQACIAKFIAQTGWTPNISLPVAGALRNESYDYFQQQILEHEVLKNRNLGSLSRDHEFTDWEALAASVAKFLSV